MKKVVDISIGGMSFSMEEDSYSLLKNYLARFEASIHDKDEAKEVMVDVENRVAEILLKERAFQNQVINIDLVNKVIDCLGRIEDMGSDEKINAGGFSDASNKQKRFYRDADDKKIWGVCSGIAHYFNIDVVLVRVVFVLALIAYGSTFWLYLILMLVISSAKTVAQKLEMRGIPVTAENIRNYSNSQNK